MEVNFFVGLNFLASSACCDNEKKIWCFVFKDLLNGDRMLSRKPIAFKAAFFFFNVFPLQKQLSKWYFFCPPRCYACSSVSCETFLKNSTVKKTITFSINTVNKLICFSVSLSVCQVHFDTQWQTTYLFFPLRKNQTKPNKTQNCADSFQSLLVCCTSQS